MPRSLVVVVLSFLVTVSALQAAPRRVALPRPVDHGGRLIATGHAAAKLDTVVLLGGPDRPDGKFQDDANPYISDLEGWTGVDRTTSTVSHWQASAFHSPTGTTAAWCGGLFRPCSETDPPEGYPNDLRDNLVWYGTVADTLQTTDVSVALSVSWDTEPAFDFLFLQVWRRSQGSWYTEAAWDGVGTELGVTLAFSVPPEDLDAGRVRWRLRASSDPVWSDADCNHPTAAGLCQVDDVTVSGSNGLAATFDDFEGGVDASSFVREYDQGAGQFAQVWPGLVSLDPCDRNQTPRVAFIDDGVVVPCTGGTLGTTWTYGPGGYGVNVSGGCLGSSSHIDNEIWSPPIAWADDAGLPLPSVYASALLEYDLYLHNPLENGLFAIWGVRSSADDGQTWSGWMSDGLVDYSNAPVTRREQLRLDELLVSDVSTVQIALGVFELGWLWGFPTQDPTPAPYFDNVSFKVFPTTGPILSVEASQLAQDAFPAIGTLDHSDLGRNDVPVDMARDFERGDGGTYVPLPNDSLVVQVRTVGESARLVGAPRLHYALRANPLFDPYRAHPAAGSVAGLLVDAEADSTIRTFAFDLPDEDFLYPGDILHYYIRAEQDGPLAGATTLPESLAGFGVFRDDPDWTPGLWPELFAMNALPGMFTALPGDQTSWLFWQDGGPKNAVGEWIAALGAAAGTDRWDVYTTNDPASREVFGLGGHATLDQISGYDVIIYDAGVRRDRTLLGPGDVPEGRDDIALLDAWLDAGGRLILFGDGIADDLRTSTASAFLADRLGVAWVDHDIQDLLPGPRNPFLVPDALGFPYTLMAVNACPDRRRFDAVTALPGTHRLYQWREEGLADYAAAVYREHGAGQVCYVPVGFDALWSVEPPSPGGGPVAARAALLADMLWTMGILPGEGWSAVGAAPAPMTLSVRPNPFNPEVELRFTAPRDAHALIEIYDIRGARVRTLLDARVAAGAHTASWDGRDDRGAAQASGVYFARVRVGEEQRVEKLALIR